MTGDVRDLIPLAQRPAGDTTHDIWYGKVVKPAPVDVSHEMYVVIPDISTDLRWGPCRWHMRAVPTLINVGTVGQPIMVTVAEVVLPAIGDGALVLFDNRQTPWVVMTWPGG